MVTTGQQVDNTEKVANKLYLATWRWHFYAGVYVTPFLIVLALTGLAMLYAPQLERVQYSDRLFVTPEGQMTSAEAQLAAVRGAYPEGTVEHYIPPTAADRSAQFAVRADGQELNVFVNPYTAAVLGEVNQARTVEHVANDIHGSLLLGDRGDRLIEIAAGLAIMLVITGLYMWWPRDARGRYRAFAPRLNLSTRANWKDLHSSVGFYISAGLAFFLLSGMAWTGVWGGQLVQPWNSFPAEKFDAPLSDQSHSSLNQGAVEDVPWALEQTLLPVSGTSAGAPGLPAGTPVNLDSVSAYAREAGFTGFRINLPTSAEGVYTVSADTMSGDITNPREDRTLHLDQYTGQKLAEVGWPDYSLVAKGMAAGIALHQGDAGFWNVALNTVFCLAVLFIAVSGVAMWWLRRPQGVVRLAAPPMPANMPMWKGAMFVMLLVSLAFPLVGVTLIIVLALDLLLVSRIPVLRKAFN